MSHGSNANHVLIATSKKIPSLNLPAPSLIHKSLPAPPCALISIIMLVSATLPPRAPTPSNMETNHTQTGSLSGNANTHSKSCIPWFSFGLWPQQQWRLRNGSGVLGLARDPISIVSQLSSTFGRVFSYCLPYLKDSKGYLALGRSTTSSSTATKYTPIIKDPSQPSRNFIHFIGISIDGRKLPIDPSILNSPGTILDTGTPITRLPAKAYTVLRDSFRRLMAAYPLGEKAKTLDTCYLITEAKLKQIPLPKIVMHFKDVDVEVHRSGILVKTRKVFCLAFSAKRDEGTPGIIGNKQQSTYEVVYDLDGEKIGFRPNGCS
ncbi:hypothetical protein Syun_022411 [Stephania yunnanensis]|uniref:Peptidase A1 domain-containing protein n=1 Tax=Stephania yunnanensis TaxID=152371 RepID=A0AAP0F9H0_9MAGN